MAKIEHSDFAILLRIALILGCVFLLVACMPLVTLYLLPIHKDGNEINERIKLLGTYGDMFGMLNSVFSGAALTGAIYAVILQRRDRLERVVESEKLDKIRRRTAIRESYNSEVAIAKHLVDFYAAQYANNISKYDETYKVKLVEIRYPGQSNPVTAKLVFTQDMETLNETPEEAILLKDTMRGKLLHYRKKLEELIERHPVE